MTLSGGTARHRSEMLNKGTVGEFQTFNLLLRYVILWEKVCWLDFVSKSSRWQWANCRRQKRCWTNSQSMSGEAFSHELWSNKNDIRIIRSFNHRKKGKLSADDEFLRRLLWFLQDFVFPFIAFLWKMPNFCSKSQSILESSQRHKIW